MYTKNISDAKVDDFFSYLDKADSFRVMGNQSCVVMSVSQQIQTIKKIKLFVPFQELEMVNTGLVLHKFIQFARYRVVLCAFWSVNNYNRIKKFKQREKKV